MKRIVASAFACVLCLTVLGSAVSAAGPTSASNQRAAARDTAQLLNHLLLPRGTVRLSGEPRGDGGLLRHPDSIPSGLLVDRHRFWLVREPLERVVGFLDLHGPRGARKSGWGWSSGRHVPPNETVTFSFPAVDGRTSLRELLVTIVSLSQRSSGVRADAQEIWVVPRPASEMVPASVREVDVGTSHAHVRVTAPAKVRLLVRWFDSLPIVQPGAVYHCPVETARRATMRLGFRSADGGLLARASVPGARVSGYCASIQFWIGSHREQPLSGHLYRRIERLLGGRFG